MNAIPVHIGAKGRVVLPARIRHVLALDEGAELLARVEGDSIVLEPRTAAVQRLQTLVGRSTRSREGLVDALLSERRAETRPQK